MLRFMRRTKAMCTGCAVGALTTAKAAGLAVGNAGAPALPNAMPTKMHTETPAPEPAGTPEPEATKRCDDSAATSVCIFLVRSSLWSAISVFRRSGVVYRVILWNLCRLAGHAIVALLLQAVVLAPLRRNHAPEPGRGRHRRSASLL